MTFAEFCQSLGLLVDQPAQDGEWHRCRTDDKPRKKNGGYQLSVDGRRGAAINFATMLEHAKWRPDEDAPAPTRAELARLRRRNERLARRRKEERRHAAEDAREFYRDCRPLRGVHPYLEAHQLDVAGCEGLKVDDEGWLVVPMFRRTPKGNHEVSTVQRISPEGKKLFWKDAPTSGASYAIPRQYASLTVLCEGLATGLALYAALHPSPSARVLVAFTAGNLYHRDVVKRVPDGPVVVAADNDAETEQRTGENPGVQAAHRAGVLLGCGVAVPECVSGTDWADYREERFIHYKERLHAFGRDFMAREQANADIRRAVLPKASMNRLQTMVTS